MMRFCPSRQALLVVILCMCVVPSYLAAQEAAPAAETPAPEPELRANRLRLLAAIPATLGQVADFSRIEGP